MATPKDRPGRLDIVARARSENAPWLSALSRCRREVGHAGRAGLAGIVWLFFAACQYLERSREPGRRLARPMEFSRTRDPAWRREGAEGRILAKCGAFFLNPERVSRKTTKTKSPAKERG